MVKIRKIDAAALDKPRATSDGRELSPLARRRLAQTRRFKSALSNLSDAETAYEIWLEKDEKPATIRQRLLGIADEMHKDIVVRRSARGWFVALATAERRSRRRVSAERQS